MYLSVLFTKAFQAGGRGRKDHTVLSVLRAVWRVERIQSGSLVGKAGKVGNPTDWRWFGDLEGSI